MTLSYKSSIGSYFPIGATVFDTGVNFSIFSRHASGAELLLYETAGSQDPFQIISLNHKTNRSFFFWHVFVEALPVGSHYTWRIVGPNNTALTGLRFNAKKELIDPWAKAITDTFWDRRRASDPNDESRSSYRGVVAKSDYVWSNERAFKKGLEGVVIYEMHVAGFRFDLASVFTRGEDGTPLANSPLPWPIEFSNGLNEANGEPISAPHTRAFIALSAGHLANGAE